MAETLSSLSSFREQMPLPARMEYGWVKLKFVPHPTWDNGYFCDCTNGLRRRSGGQGASSRSCSWRSCGPWGNTRMKACHTIGVSLMNAG